MKGSLFSLKGRGWRTAVGMLAGILFLSLGCSQTVEKDLFVPVRVEGMPADRILVQGPAKGIEIRVRGPQSRIESLKKARLQYLLDMTDIPLGMQSIPVDPERIKLPRGVTLIRILPEHLVVETARQLRKALKVTVTLSGKPAPKRQVNKTDPKPAFVIMRGPEALIRALTSVATKPIDVTGAAESFQKEIALEIPQGLILEGPSRVITARIEIGDKIATRWLRGVPIAGKGTAYWFRITPPAIDIQVKGPVRILGRLKRKKKGIEVYMDLKGLEPGVYPRRAHIKLPTEVTLVASRPEIFTVKIYGSNEEEE